jgi:hypothetical protein
MATFICDATLGAAATFEHIGLWLSIWDIAMLQAWTLRDISHKVEESSFLWGRGSQFYPEVCMLFVKSFKKLLDVVLTRSYRCACESICIGLVGWRKSLEYGTSVQRPVSQASVPLRDQGAQNCGVTRRADRLRLPSAKG